MEIKLLFFIQMRLFSFLFYIAKIVIIFHFVRNLKEKNYRINPLKKDDLRLTYNKIIIKKLKLKIEEKSCLSYNFNSLI